MKTELKQKVSIEYEELNSKLERLNNFIDTEAYCSLDKTNQLLLKSQATAMATYSNILVARLELL